MSVKLPGVLEQIRALLSHPSVSCTDPGMDQGNLGVIHLLAEWLESLGFHVDVLPLSEGKANLLATLGGTPNSGEGLVLAGHTDTVPYDLGRWSMDPFVGAERDQRIYGLGSADMKSFFALAMAAVSAYAAKDFRRPLTILATADEESSMAGAKDLVRRGLRPGRYAIIGEPTGLRPVRLHKGVMMESIRVSGQAGHSSDPTLGANAIEGMYRVLAELLRWRDELQARYRNPAFRVAAPTLNLGAIHGGDNPNRICGHCDLHIDIRPLPGMDMAELRLAMAERLEPVLANDPKLHLRIQPLIDGVPAFETPADASLVRACEELSGAEADSVAFGTEAPFLTELGMETVVLGAGNIQQAHQPDEYLELAQIEPMVEILKGLIRRY